MSGINTVNELLIKKGLLCTKDIATELNISQQHAHRLFTSLSDFNDIEVVSKIISIKNRDFLIKFLKKKT